jgi:hypothetical protein
MGGPLAFLPFFFWDDRMADSEIESPAAPLITKMRTIVSTEEGLA